MVKSYLTLFLKFELKRIFSYFILLFLLIFLLESSQLMLESPLYLYLGLVMSVLGFTVIYLWIKTKKIFVILDTKLKQEQFKDENGINPLEGRKAKAKYNIWLLKKAEKASISRIYKKFFSYNSQHYCLYCYLSILPIIIVWVFVGMYMTPTEALVTSVIFVGCLIFLCLALEKRGSGVFYKHLDSEIKQILFEEVTGYNPLNNGKMTYKYKAWLILEE